MPPAIVSGSTGRSLSSINRRSFLKSVGTGIALTGTASLRSQANVQEPLSFGLIADVHHGLCPSAFDRLEVFMEEVDRRKPGFMLQLGDFCYGDAGSRPFLDLWSQFKGPKYHVLGNHDMDRVSKPAVMEAWEMPENYYSFDAGGFHIVVLDCNFLKLDGKFVDYDTGNYFRHPTARAHVSPEQLEWLRSDLKGTDKPSLVFTHQGLGLTAGAANREAVRSILKSAVRKDGSRKVVACFCGHHHVDRLTPDDGIPQIWVNSASYHWVGEKYGRMADYRDSLFAFVTLDPKGTISVSGRTSEFVPPSPKKRGYPNWEKVQPMISHHRIEF